MDPAIRYSKWLDAQDKKKSKKDAFDEQNTEDAAGKKTNPVPVLDQLGRWTNQFATDAYTGWRDQRRMAGNLGMVGSALKDATYFGHQLDKAQMLAFMNSPLGQARTSLTAQQAMAVPRLAKAALIEAIAKRQGAANEFGQLGTQRTYFTG